MTKLTKKLALGLLGFATYMAQSQEQQDFKIIKDAPVYELTGNFTSPDAKETYQVLHTKDGVKIVDGSGNVIKENTSRDTANATYKSFDYNDDGRTDILIAAYDGKNKGKVLLLENTGSGFTKRELGSFGYYDRSGVAPSIDYAIDGLFVEAPVKGKMETSQKILFPSNLDEVVSSTNSYKQ